VIERKSSPLLRLHATRRALFSLVLASNSCFVPALHAQERLVTLDPVQTKVEFTVGSTLHTFHGTFKLKSGQIRFDPVSGKAAGAIVVDAMSGNSDSEGRDKKMHQQVLESQKYSEIVFTPALVKGAIAPQGTSQLELSGIFRLRGQDHDLTLAIAVEPLAAGQLRATANFSVPYIKWGLKNPSNFFLKVDDTVGIEIHATGRFALDPAQH
jgi:polyisoprenoid-binding protein YceI